MANLKFTLRGLLIFIAIAAIFISHQLFSQKQWARTNRQNANASYWTMRMNLESSRRTIAPADYEVLRKKIDDDWKELNPELELPDDPAE
jgi:hypothetical protein